MPLILADRLTKVFRTYRRREGLAGAFRDLFSRGYEDVRAVDGVSFAIEAGESVGYIGPNGAGKSTTMKMLAGILVPTGGRVEVAGRVPHLDRRRHLREIGVVFGQRTQLWWDIAVVESFNLLATIYGIDRSELKATLKRFDEILGVGGLLHTPVRKLSLGQRMRCELAGALLHSPRILFLDEPTIGLDVTVKESLREFISEMNRSRGVTLLLATHDVQDIRKLSRRIMVIDRGRLIHDGGLEELHRRYAPEGVVSFKLQRPREGAVDAPPDRPGLVWDRVGDSLLARYSPAMVRVSEIMKEALARFDVADVTVAPVSTEDVIRNIYRARGEGVH